jgi:prepilin-type N-terminal cleavage/methylation domain-containing protein
MRYQPNSHSAHLRRSGFSLVELLTVIAIISVLMTVSVIGLNGLASGKGVSTAVSTTEAVFEEARALAIGRRTNAAVLVSVQDPRDRETYLRRLVVARKEVNPETNQQEGDWVLESRGTTLPDKVYYSVSLSKQDHKNGSGSMKTVSLSNVKREYQGEYYIYEFNSEGLCTTPGASFVIGTGSLPPGDKRPHVVAEGKKDFGGFVIWRNGGTSVFRDPTQIPVPSNLKRF